MGLTVGQKWKRFLFGIILVIVILGVVFSWLPGWIRTYGSTEEELRSIYPGDEILNEPVVEWTHGISIKAPKGGYYSYTFIENLVSQADIYHNAATIIPHFQNPQPGDPIIDTILLLKEVKTEDYILASTNDFLGMGWTWGWFLNSEDSDNTRLVIRMKIQTPPEANNPPVTWILNAGGFVMEMGMLRGIRERAEGWLVPSPIEPLEIFLWFSVLIMGFMAAWRFVNRIEWQFHLGVGLVSVLGLLVFTFLQPLVILRIIFVLMMFLAVWLSKN
jgi:hypothetical protein